LTSLRWFATLQTLISAGLVTVLWVLYLQLGRRPFFKWWARAWTLFAAYLLLGLLTLPLSAGWNGSRAALALAATICGFLQPVLLVFGAISLRDPAFPTRRWQTLTVAAALAAAVAGFAVSLSVQHPVDSFSVRLAPRALALACASLFCFVVLVRGRREGGAWAYPLTGLSYLAHGLVQGLYGLAAIGRLTFGADAPFAALFDGEATLRPRLFLLDVTSAYGICIGMVLLLIEDFKRSTKALEENLRLRREALDENAMLQAEIKERRRIEGALRDSEDRYRDLVEHSEDLICTHNLSGQILSVNAAAARNLGYQPDELTRLTVQELLVPGRADDFERYVEVIKSSGLGQGLLTVVTRGGEQRIWEYRNTLRTEGVPTPVVRSMARDVTERIVAERAHRLSEAKYLAAFRATPCSVAISSLEDGHVLEVNDACERQTGYARSEIIGRSTLELGLWVCPNDRADIVDELKAIGRVSNREVRWRAKNGDELTILYSADMLRMHGQDFMLSVALDITSHKQVEARHRAILRALPDWMFLVNNEGVFLDCQVKDTTYLLAQPEAFIGRAVKDVLPPALAEDITRLFDRVARTDEAATLEYSVPGQEGVRYYEARAVRCDQDKILSLVRDVTEGKRAELQAIKLRQELAHIGRVTTFAALTGSLTHEIRQPLTAIRTNAQAALRLISESPGMNELRNALADIVAESQRAADVMVRVGTMLKRDAQRHASVNLNAAVTEIAKILRADLLARRIRLKVDLEAGLPEVLGDRVQLQQVALNLVMNACDAVKDQPDGSRIVSLRTSSQDATVTVSISDNGPGLTSEELSLVFEPFYTTKLDGMGLGLPICEMIMHVHEGTLAAERNPDGGMTFSFSLGVRQSAATAVGASTMRGATAPKDVPVV
jgi:PAS domain S-box-containing protein